MTEAAKRLRARAELEDIEGAAAHAGEMWSTWNACKRTSRVLRELAAELDALPAEPVPLWLPSDALADAESFLRTANEETRSWPGMKSHAASLARHIVRIFKERPAEPARATLGDDTVACAEREVVEAAIAWSGPTYAPPEYGCEPSDAECERLSGAVAALQRAREAAGKLRTSPTRSP